MSQKKKYALTPTQPDIGEAEAAYQQTLGALEAVPKTELGPVRVDLQIAGAIAYSVAIRDIQPARRSRLALVNQQGIFDIAALDRLPTRSLCAWHVRRKQLELTEAASAARVSEAGLLEAQQTRGRMLRVLTYYYEDDPEYQRRLVAIRAGRGYQDLANDLLAVAEFYEEPEVHATISRDPRHYRSEDPKAARQLAQQLFRALGILNQGEAARYADLAQRAWYLLSRDYACVRAAGRLVFLNDEDVDSSYPSLVTAARAPAARPNPEPPPEAGSKETESD